MDPYVVFKWSVYGSNAPCLYILGKYINGFDGCFWVPGSSWKGPIK